MFLDSYLYFVSDATFLLKFWHTLKQVQGMLNAAAPCIFSNMHLQLDTPFLSKGEGP